MNNRLGKFSFILLCFSHIPICFLAILGYVGFLYPILLSLLLILLIYFRIRTVDYVLHVGKMVDIKKQQYQEAPWVVLWLLNLGVGFGYLFQMNKAVDGNSYLQFSIAIPVVILAGGGIIEFFRRIRF